MTKTQISKLDASLFKTRNTTTVAGNSWTYKAFVRRFKSHFPELENLDCNDKRDIPKIVAVYVNINKLLKFRGMAFKASNYYEKFTLIQTPINKVDSLNKTARVERLYAAALDTGITTYDNQYTDRLIAKEISAIAGQSSLRVDRVSY